MPIADMGGKKVTAAQNGERAAEPAGTRGRPAIWAALAAAVVIGFTTETASIYGELWLFLLAVFAPLALVITVALTVSLGEKVTLPDAVVSGVMSGSGAGVVFVLTIFSLFALELGGRDLYEFGGDVGWVAALIMGLVLYGVGGGAAMGAVCGTAAWMLRITLAQRPWGRKPDTRQAGQ